MQPPHKLDLSRLAVLDRIADRSFGARRAAQERANDLHVQRHTISRKLDELRETLRRSPHDQHAARKLAEMEIEFNRLATPLQQADANREQINEIANAAGLLAAHTRDWAIAARLIEDDQ